MAQQNNPKLQRLIDKLKELFQLDQPDLDFGFYRIMHAKSAEVTQFLEKDLLSQVRAAFAQYRPADKAHSLAAHSLTHSLTHWDTRRFLAERSDTYGETGTCAGLTV